MDKKITVLGAFVLLALGAASYPVAGATRFKLIHSNDLHSHFRPERSALGLGGVARIRTKVKELRAQAENSLFVDGGDWAEGEIYYTLGAGEETLRMMDALDYDVAVVGNHDWLNGPDHLLDSYLKILPKVDFVTCNLDASNYPRKEDFEKVFRPYVIRQIGDVKVAFIGLSTFQFVFDDFVKPLKVLPPFKVLRERVKELSLTADILVLVSHNAIPLNVHLLQKIPELDFVIGGHDHIKLPQGVRVQRPGYPDAYVFETQKWGRYIGDLDLTLRSREEAKVTGLPRVGYESYRLHQIDHTIPADPEVESLVLQAEAKIESKLGPVFHDEIAKNETYFSHGRLNSSIGNLAADAYREFTGAQAALESPKFIYGELHPGIIHSATVYGAMPAIYDPKVDRSWTLKTIQLKGNDLFWLLNVYLGVNSINQKGLVATSGLEVVFDPVFLSSSKEPRYEEEPIFIEAGRELSWRNDSQYERLKTLRDSPVIKSIKINGAPLVYFLTYKIAVSEGILRSLQFINQFLPDALPLGDVNDTQVEAWRIVRDSIAKKKKLTTQSLGESYRFRTLHADLGIRYDDVRWDTQKGQVAVTVRNYGTTPSLPGGYEVRLRTNLNGDQMNLYPKYVSLGDGKTLQSLAAGETQEVVFDGLGAHLTQETKTPIWVEIFQRVQETSILETAMDVNLSNNSLLRWIVPQQN